MKNSAIIVLAVLCSLAAALRLSGLDVQSLWFDELCSWKAATQQSWKEVVEHTATQDVHPPGYYLLLHAVVLGLGDSAPALRLASALAGIAAVPATFLLGSRACGTRVGLTAAALMTTTWAPLYYSQEARSYSLMLLFSILSSWAWLRWMSAGTAGQRAWQTGLCYGLLATIQCWLHYFGVGLVLFQALAAIAWIALGRREPTASRASCQGHSLQVLAIFLVIACCFAPCVPLLFEQRSRGAAHWIEAPGAEALFGTLRFFLNRSSPLAFAFIGAMVGTLIHKKRARQRKAAQPQLTPTSAPARLSTPFLVAWLVLPCAGAWLFSHFFTPLYTHRNLLICLPPALVLLSYAIWSLPPRAAFAAAILFPCGTLVDDFFGKDYYRKIRKDEYREAFAWIAEEAPNANQNFLLTHEGNYCDYYLRNLPGKQQLHRTQASPRALRDLAALVRESGARRLWYIESSHNDQRIEKTFLDRHYPMIREQGFRGVSVSVYRLISLGSDGTGAQETAR